MSYIKLLDDLAEKYKYLEYYIPTLQYKLQYMAPIHNCINCDKYYYTRHGIKCECCKHWVCSNCIKCKNENDTNIIKAIQDLEGLEHFNQEQTEKRIDDLNELLCYAYDGFYCPECFRKLC